MNSSPSAVQYQTFNPLAAAACMRAEPPVITKVDPPWHQRLPGLVPSATKPLFVGEFGKELASVYLQHYQPASSLQLAWDDELPPTIGEFDLIVIRNVPEHERAAEQLSRLSRATGQATQLFVCESGSEASTDRLIELLMNTGWMPEALPPLADEPPGDSALAGCAIQAVKAFDTLSEDQSAEARFSVVVACQSTPPSQSAAFNSPGLREVGAEITLACDPGSAAQALASALAIQPNADPAPAWVLVCQPQAYFPAGFGRRLNALLADIPVQDHGNSLLGFMGIGVDAQQQGFAPAGFVVEGLRRESHPESLAAVSLDELAIVLSRDSMHRIDPAMGWQFWATDLCLASICQHKVFPRIARMPILHSRSSLKPNRDSVYESAALLLHKYPEFGPIPTLNGMVDASFVEQHRNQNSDKCAKPQPYPPQRHEPQAEAMVPVRVASIGHAQAEATIEADAGHAAITCSICNRGVSKWSPHPQMSMRSEFMKMLGTVGSDLSVYQCPHCHSTDRDRHLWHYMRAVGLLQSLPAAQILHIAPERPLEILIEALEPLAYLRGDLFPRQDNHLKLDIESLPFDDCSLDLIICNHVLEHVASPARALAEFHRCLIPGGVLIAQTPFAPALKNTLELNRPVSPGFARLFYGQEDHVRLFGADIVDYFHAAGFSGEPLSHASVLGEMDAKAHGCNAIEPFFAFTK